MTGADTYLKNGGFIYSGENGVSASTPLSGIIEKNKLPKDDDRWFDGRDEYTFSTFLPVRRIGGTEINGRKIKGWKEVPTVMEWSSTYRGKKFLENFKELSSLMRQQELSEIFITGKDLSNKDKNFNHALCVFINSFLTQENQLFDDESLGVYDFLDLLKHEDVTVTHAKDIYLNNQYRKKNEKKFEVINDKRYEYSEFKLFTYEQVVDEWLTYMRRVDKMDIELVNLTDEESKIIEANHRWNQAYAEKMLAKFYDLEQSEYSKMWTSMVSLTTYQDKVEGKPDTPENWEHENRGPSWFESMERLRESLGKILDVLRRISNEELECDFHYIWIVEAHKTGYPHIHLGIFGDVAEWLDKYTNKLRVRQLLEDKYDMGRSGIATDFKTKPPSGDGAIQNMSNYMMKYFNKNFGELASKYEDESIKDKDRGTLVYNACMWLSSYRSWGTSESVGSVMKTDTNESDKEYVNLGGSLTTPDDADFDTLVQSSGSDELRHRVAKRQEFRSAVEQRRS